MNEFLKQDMPYQIEDRVRKALKVKSIDPDQPPADLAELYGSGKDAGAEIDLAAEL